MDYAALGALLGKSVGALRVMKSRGQLPEPDGPGPSWRRERLTGLLAEGSSATVPPLPDDATTAVGLGLPVAAPAPRSGPAATPATPGPAGAGTGAPATSASRATWRPRSEPWDGGDDPEERRKRSMSLADVLACPHPEEERKRTGWGSLCVRCGRLQSGRDSWSGGGHAAWQDPELTSCPHPEEERTGPLCRVCGRTVR